jgi:transposase
VGIHATDHTIVRCILADTTLAVAASPAVRVLGVDDFAFRRGSRYGTLLMDLEQRRVIDLLPDRSQDSLAEWLRKHSDVRLITRDRSSETVADGHPTPAGAARGTPGAV